jgi:NAD(P)-dependent dehydrogenase (short-subunit alcohol dehydrogenase family)
MSAREDNPVPAIDVVTRRFVGRSALITGAANGIGRACAERLSAEGATVGVLDLDGDRARSVAEELVNAGRSAFWFGADVTDAAQVHSAFDAFEENAERFDILVNMAGIFPPGTLADLTLEEWRRVITVNLEATFITCKDVVPRMAKHNYGRITTVSSGTVHVGWGSSPAYIAAKSGIIGLTRAIAREVGVHGITINTIMPGAIVTEASMANNDKVAPPGVNVTDMIIDAQCTKRLGQPEDIAEGVAYAVSERADFFNGQVLNIGGGFSFV